MAEAVPFSSTGNVAQKTRAPRYGAWGIRFVALGYLIVLIGIPVFVVNVQGLRFGLDVFWRSITRPEAISAIQLSVTTALAMAIINTVMGTLTAFVLVRYRFPGKGIFNTLVDLPFAVPTLVTGVMLVLLYGPQTIIGGFLSREFGFRVLYDVPGIVIALLFIGYPFVIRTVQPVLMQMEPNQLEAAQTIGAGGWTAFWRIIFPVLRPAILTGAILSFARSLGEFGSIVVVSGNIPLRTQTATVYIFTRVEAGDMQAASSVSMVLLLIALVVTFSVELFQRRGRRA